MGAVDVVLFTRPGCVYCIVLRSGLDRKGITYRERNIWTDPEAAEFVRAVNGGNETVPTVTIGTTALVNPSARAVSKLVRG